MAPIKILGGGISGLTSAINLNKAGFDVEVHEKKNYCGKTTNDFQFLENWTFDQDILKFLKGINIKTNFYFKPIKKMDVFSPSFYKYVGKSKNPFMYLVKRGKAKDSIGRSLEKQAKKEGVKIVYNTKLKKDKADIIAVPVRKPAAFACGVKFKIKYPDSISVLFDKNLSLHSYSYLIANDNVMEITSCNLVGVKDLKKRLDLTLKTFQKLLGFKINKVKETFSGYVSLDVPKTAMDGNKCLVGEAAGFQDALAGFGMVYAFKSGYYASRSIIDNTDYDRLWKKDFYGCLRASFNNNRLFKTFNNADYDSLVRIANKNNFLINSLLGGMDIQLILKRLYNNPLPWFLRPQRILKPVSFMLAR